MKEEKRMDQKARIQETAFRMFTGIGYSGVTMDQIARSCGIGKGTLYQYFPSKEKLLLDCIDYFTLKLKSEIESVILDPALLPQQKASEFIVRVVRFVSGINVQVLTDIQRNVPEAYEKIESNRQKIIFANITRILEEGKEGGIFRKELNSTIVAHILIGAISHLSSPQVFEKIGLPVGQLFQTVLSIVWEGCLSEKGRKMTN